MNRVILIGLFSLICFAANSQKMLIVENRNSSRNFKYETGDDIILKINNMEGKITDNLDDMTDSTIILNIYGEIKLSSVAGIYRENWLVRILQGLSLLGGVAYFGIDSFNRLINNDSPVILAETAIISAGLIAFSFALIPLEHRKINTSGKWKLRTIDFNKY